ncbi:hypothetical protein [Roseiconus lacunae]|uniref:hypothetical protein n=1 Tax=Roseiconus lacunae TaxID=2605694 RepID=UPI001E415B5A|nr:hypothetical protein [Roseiconus lacunae]MCD0457905.1 hypothetical protein [Roseiconus lacunae]
MSITSDFDSAEPLRLTADLQSSAISPDQSRPESNSNRSGSDVDPSESLNALHHVGQHLSEVAPNLAQIESDKAFWQNHFQREIAIREQAFGRAAIEQLNDLSELVMSGRAPRSTVRHEIAQVVQDHFRRRGLSLPDHPSVESLDDEQRFALSELLGDRESCYGLNAAISRNSRSLTETSATLHKNLKFLLGCLADQDQPRLNQPQDFGECLSRGVEYFERENNSGNPASHEKQQLKEFLAGIQSARDAVLASGGGDFESLTRQIQYAPARQMELTANELKQTNLSRNVRGALAPNVTFGRSVYRSIKGYRAGTTSVTRMFGSETEKQKALALVRSLYPKADAAGVVCDSSDYLREIAEEAEGSPEADQLRADCRSLELMLYRIGVPHHQLKLSEIESILERLQVGHAPTHAALSKRQFQAFGQLAINLEEIQSKLNSPDQREENESQESLEAARARILASVREQGEYWDVKPEMDDAQLAAHFVNRFAHEQVHRGQQQDAINHNDELQQQNADKTTALHDAWQGIQFAVVGGAELKHDLAEFGASSIEAEEAFSDVNDNSAMNMGSDNASETAVMSLEFLHAIFGMFHHAKSFLHNLRQRPVRCDVAPVAVGQVRRERQAIRRELAQLHHEQSQQQGQRRFSDRVKSFFKFRWLFRKSREKQMAIDAIGFSRFTAGAGAMTAKVAGATGTAVAAVSPSVMLVGSVLGILKSIESASEYANDQSQIKELERQMQEVVDACGSDYPELRGELESILRMYELRRDNKQNVAKAGYTGTIGAGLGLTSAVGLLALSGGSAAVLTIGAPATLAVGTAMAIVHAVYSQGRTYCNAEANRLLEDAMTGRIGDTYAKHVRQAADKTGSEADRFLFDQICSRDPRRVAGNLVASLKREVSHLTDQEIINRLAEKPLESPVGIYGESRSEEQEQRDQRRLQNSPTAMFLQTCIGLTESQVLTIVDCESSDDGVAAQYLYERMQ